MRKHLMEQPNGLKICWLHAVCLCFGFLFVFVFLSLVGFDIQGIV